MIRDNSLYDAAKKVKQRFGGRARPNLIDNPEFNRQIKQVAVESGVNPEALKSTLLESIEFYKTRQDYVSQGATQPVPIGRKTEQGEDIYRAPTTEEREAKKYYATSKNTITARAGMARAPIGAREISKEEFEGYKAQLARGEMPRQLIVSSTGQTMNIPISARAPAGWETFVRAMEQKRLAQAKAEQIVRQQRRISETYRSLGYAPLSHETAFNIAQQARYQQYLSRYKKQKGSVPTSSLEFQKDLFRRLGYDVRETPNGNLQLIQGNMQVVVSPAGMVIKGPKGAIFRPEFAREIYTYTENIGPLRSLQIAAYNVLSLLSALRVLSSKSTTMQQKNKALKVVSRSVKNLSKNKRSKNTVSAYITNYIRNYPAVFRTAYLTKEGAYNVLKYAAKSITSPIVGGYKSIEQVARDITLSNLMAYVNTYYMVIKPKTKKEREIKNLIYNKLEKAIISNEAHRQKYKKDILNAMIIEGIIALPWAAGSAAASLAARGAIKTSAVLKTVAHLPIKLIWRYQIADAIIRPNSENLGGILPWIIINKISSASVPISFRRYLSKLPKVQRKIIGNTWKVGKIVRSEIGKSKLREYDFKDVIKNGKVRKAFTAAMKETKAVLYGSKVENAAKIEYIRNVYSKILGRKLTKEEGLKAFFASNRNIPKDVLISLLDKPKDLDLVIQGKYVGDLISKLNSKYRYVPEMIQEYIRSKLWTKKMDFGLKLIRRDRSSVMSILSKVQIDDILKGLTTNAETTAFKLAFLEKLYSSRAIPKSVFREFRLEGLGLANSRLKLALDLHSDSDVTITKKVLGFINKKENVQSLELPKKANFRKAILDLQKTKNYIIDQKQIYLKKIAGRFAKDFKKIGLILNKENFVKIFPKFLQRSEITDVKSFDFLEAQKPAVNKQILKTYKQAIDFIIMNTPASLASRRAISKDVKINILAQKLVQYAKSTASKLTEFDAAISELDARRLILVYYSAGSRGLWNAISKFDVKGFKLKKELSEKEQQLLLEMMKKFDKKLQGKYTDAKINQELNKIKFKTTLPVLKKFAEKGFVDLGKTVDREFQVIKNFNTRKLIVTKDGKWSLSPKEQIDRRVAGTIRRMFESRRAKDLKKLYNDLKLIELIQRNIVKAYKTASVYGKARLLARFRKGTSILKLKIKKFMKLADAMTSDMQRIESIFTTKGVSETVGLKEIRFDDYNSASAKNVLNRLQIRNTDISRIEAQMELRLRQQISRETMIRRGTNIIAERIIKAAERRVIPKQSIRYVVRQLRGIMLPIAASKVKQRLYRNNSIYSYNLPSKSISYIQRSISKVVSYSLSHSISQSQISSISRSISASVSKSASLSQSKSKSLSQSISRSISKSISQSRSQSRSRSQSKSRSMSRSISRSKNPPKIPPIIIPLPTFNTKLPKGYRRLINPIVRIRGINRELKWRTTFNRALKRIIRLVDNTTARSFQLKIVGVTRAQDISQPQSLRKFRLRRGKDKRVLIFVERSKYAIDTKGEKKGLRLGKLKKRR